MKGRLRVILIFVTIFVFMGVSGTFAYLVASTRPVVNTFSPGDISLTLTETTGDGYIVCPGVPIQKDPVVTVKKGSVDCWLFARVTKSADFDSFMSYQIADGWQLLDGYTDVYYREVQKSAEDVGFPLIKDNTISVYDTVTEKMLAALTNKPTLEFKAYAIQRAEFDSVVNAWQTISKEG